MRNTQAFLPRKSNIFDVRFFVHSVCSILLYPFSFIHKSELVNKFQAVLVFYRHLRGHLGPVYVNSPTVREEKYSSAVHLQ